LFCAVWDVALLGVWWVGGGVGVGGGVQLKNRAVVGGGGKLKKRGVSKFMTQQR